MKKMKMFVTQLTGLLQRIATSEEENIEDTARLLAQARAGEGNIYFATFGEMESVLTNAIQAAEPFPRLKRWSPDVELDRSDRVWIITRSSKNEEALTLARKLYDSFIPFSVMASEAPGEENELSELAYTYISLKITKGILPAEDGSRVVQPHSLAAMFVYEAVKWKLDEMFGTEE